VGYVGVDGSMHACRCIEYATVLCAAFLKYPFFCMYTTGQESDEYN